MTQSGADQDDERQRGSAAAEAAALRWEESQPDEPGQPASTPPDRPSIPRGLSDRRSASADAAALRWQEQHPDGDDD
jgi:hypothetical protein